MSLRTLLFGTFSFVLLWFVGWMAWSVFAARSALPQIFEPHRTSGAWAALTPQQQGMLLSVEDPGFFDHTGLDWSTPGTGKTIPQRLATWMFEGKASPGISPLEHALIAVLVITPLTDKTTQLNAYVSTAPLGTRNDAKITGFAEAAKVYFRTPVEALSTNQFARILALVEDPDEFEMNSEANWQRVEWIEALMAGTCRPLDGADSRLGGCAQ